MGYADVDDRIMTSDDASYTCRLAMTIDRESRCPAIVLSNIWRVEDFGTLSWCDVEYSDSTYIFPFSISKGITPDIMSEIEKLTRPPSDMEHLEKILKGMYEIFTQNDATILELYLLWQTASSSFTLYGPNFYFDDAAVKRQQNMIPGHELKTLCDRTKEVAEEIEAEKYGLVYIKMDGNIGNIVNGAGLAMATNDAIGLYGGASSNFLDAGGQATKETMQEAFGIVMRDYRVTAILVNIYGGKKLLLLSNIDTNVFKGSLMGV